MKRREFIKYSSTALTAAVLSNAVKAEKRFENHDMSVEQKNKGNKMKIVVLTGSPRHNGNSAILAEQFIKGAQEKGHEVFRFDCAFKHVEPCRACNRCGMNGVCIYNDDFVKLRPHLISADMVVFATPMYYFGVSTQLKRVIDRFYAVNGLIKGVPKKAAFLMTYADTAREEAEPMLCHYRTLLKYLGWSSVGEVVASGVWMAGAVKDTEYPQQAYRLGKSL